MGLLQKAVETYGAMAHRAGQVFEGENEPLAPISHIMARPQIIITLDQSGNFVAAQVLDKNTPKIIIPATEESAGRTVKAAELPHPLCDYLRYLLPQNQVEYQHYISQLSTWANSSHTHPKLHAVLNYVQGGTILENLRQAGIDSEEKAMVCWVVNGLGETLNGPCWTDRTLMNAFIDYYHEKRTDTPPALCMISGELEMPAGQHPKGIVPISGNAKLISANDSSGFTYRGRFDDAAQAATVGYAASQKAHSVLRWLVANQSVSFGGRTFLCWNPQGIQVPRVTGPMGRRSGTAQRAANPSQYQKQLREALSGWKEDLPQSAGVVIAAFDAATTGRLAVTYYNELLASDFLDRLHDWEASCCWEDGPYGIQSPSLFQIVSWAFGTPRNGKAEMDDRILSQQMQRLVACRVDKAPFPLDIERALAEKASHLLLYEGENRQKLLFTACAAIRKYHCDHLKEEWDMALDKNCSDRSYLFGRLLAIADAIENNTYTDEDRRETNAIRMQKAFTLRPMTTWSALWDKLRPYNKRLAQSKPGLYRYYHSVIDDILNRLSPFDPTLNQKLNDIYLLGYSHQRAYRTEKSDSQETEE
ncbi:type I-C CRISPR-associated protein Cas8c/Csd1 [uncultured Oscillibacter sp.]|jgi:CRISPR-associated protein Csd1|uniref:type I-C CRISPR-associated protein Cas8c/Csd1 n=1 Tax=uncultured Oscillibacter sp. TaxID=876091 RepID=UPI00261F6A62|nr:type I-C CRISPR-associated protein Cas8c/Csd1 [uncultured Oscillibacter sp.]